MQVGPPEDGYRLTVGGFNSLQSTLGVTIVLQRRQVIGEKVEGKGKRV